MILLRVFGLLMLAVSLSWAQSVFSVRDEGEGRNRTYDVVHYRIEVSFDESKKMVFGTTTTTLVPFLPGLATVDFDAEKMTVQSVTMKNLPLKFDVRPKTLAVHLDKPYSPRDTLTLSISYTCTPARGLFFVQPDSANPDRPRQIWSQGEDMDNHFWFPCYDFPNDMATSEMIVTVRDSYQALSNGRLLSVREDRGKKTKTFHWKQDKPHVSYLIMLAAGEYTVLRDKAGDIPLEYWVYPRHVADAKVCFARTPDMVKWFSTVIGYPYPWAKYAQVLIRDFTVGGMENTSATSLADEAAVYDARARVDESPNSLIAHELAHQWWGDVLTCKDWRHLWLNESFASYFDPLWFEHDLGRDEFDYLMYNAQQAGINSDKTAGRKPIVSVGSYGSNVYPRGASVLHMMRSILGDTGFWRAINYYITRNQHRVVETNDLKVAVEEATGQNLSWFFDQWVYKAGYPVFSLSSTWSDSAQAVLLAVKQTQLMDSLTGIFRTPVDIEVTTPEGSAVHRVTILTGDTTLTLRSPSKPNLVIFDKGNWLLKELKWTKSIDEWMYQAELAGNPVDRLRAIQELAGKEKNISSIPLFSRIALHEKFWAVRREAVLAFGKIDSANAAQKAAIAQTLIAVLADSRPEVRQAAAAQLRKYRGENVITALKSALRDSSNRVVANALNALAKADSAHAAPILIAHLDTPSHNNTIASAALSALSTVDSVKAVDAALIKARSGQSVGLRFTALGILGRYGKGRADVHQLYASVVQEKQSFMRGMAIRWLGDNGDAGNLPALQTIANDTEDRASESAKAAVDKITKRIEAKK